MQVSGIPESLVIDLGIIRCKCWHLLFLLYPSKSSFLWVKKDFLNTFNNQRDTLTHANTHGAEGIFTANLFKLV